MSNPIEKARKTVISYEHPENPVEAVSKNTFSPYQSFSGNDYYNTSSNTYSAFSTANYLNENTQENQENQENEEEPDYEPVMNPDLCILCDLPYVILCKKCNPYIRTCRNNHSWYISQNKQVKTTHNRH